MSRQLPISEKEVELKEELSKEIAGILPFDPRLNKANDRIVSIITELINCMVTEEISRPHFH